MKISNPVLAQPMPSMNGTAGVWGTVAAGSFTENPTRARPLPVGLSKGPDFADSPAQSDIGAWSSQFSGSSGAVAMNPVLNDPGAWSEQLSVRPPLPQPASVSEPPKMPADPKFVSIAGMSAIKPQQQTQAAKQETKSKKRPLSFGENCEMLTARWMSAEAGEKKKLLRTMLKVAETLHDYKYAAFANYYREQIETTGDPALIPVLQLIHDRSRIPWVQEYVRRSIQRLQVSRIPKAKSDKKAPPQKKGKVALVSQGGRIRQVRQQFDYDCGHACLAMLGYDAYKMFPPKPMSTDNLRSLPGVQEVGGIVGEEEKHDYRTPHIWLFLSSEHVSGSNHLVVRYGDKVYCPKVGVMDAKEYKAKYVAYVLQVFNVPFAK